MFGDAVRGGASAKMCRCVSTKTSKSDALSCVFFSYMTFTDFNTLDLYHFSPCILETLNQIKTFKKSSFSKEITVHQASQHFS